MLLRLVMMILVVAAPWFPRLSNAQELRISYSGISGQNLPFWVTYDAGLYKKYGLPAELVFISGGLTNIQAMMAKEIAFAYLGGSSPIQAILQGADLVILATAYGLMPYGVIAGKNIHAATELKGKRIAVSRLGGIEETAARVVDPDRWEGRAIGQQLVAHGASPDLIAAARAELDDEQRWFYCPAMARAWGRAPAV